MRLLLTLLFSVVAIHGKGGGAHDSVQVTKRYDSQTNQTAVLGQLVLGVHPTGTDCVEVAYSYDGRQPPTTFPQVTTVGFTFRAERPAGAIEATFQFDDSSVKVPLTIDGYEGSYIAAHADLTDKLLQAMRSGKRVTLRASGRTWELEPDEWAKWAAFLTTAQ